MRPENVYNPRNVVSLVAVFGIIFWLLYSLASFLHESKKIHHEIDAIRLQNEQNLVEIEEKKQRLEYLRTPQYVDKEAKMQMGKKQPGEQVLVFIEEKLPILPSELPAAQQKEFVLRPDVPVIEKWKWLLFGK